MDLIKKNSIKEVGKRYENKANRNQTILIEK